MKTKTLPRSETIRFGWDIAKLNLVFFIKLFIVFIVVTYAAQALKTEFDGRATLLAGIFLIVSIVIGTIMELGFLKIVLNFADSKPSTISTLFSITSARTVINYFVADTVFGVLVIVGLFLLIVPGIYLALKFQYYQYLIVDKDMGIIDAFKKSSRLTEGVKWELFKFDLTLILIGIAGALALMVGLVLAIPTTMTADAKMFRKLQKLHK